MHRGVELRVAEKPMIEIKLFQSGGLVLVEIFFGANLSNF